MPDGFGARLRQQREIRGIALAAIAKQTRIKETLLDALERDDLSQWPTGFYRRAFFRAYASAIQLDPDGAYREFQTVHPEPPPVDVVEAMAAALGRGEGNGRSTALRGVVGSAFSSLSRLRRSTAHDSSAPPLEETIAESRFAPPEPELSALPDPSPQAIAPAPVPEPVAELDAAEPVVESIAAPVPVAPVSAAETELDLLELARLCADLGCVTSTDETVVLLKEAARILDATGLIVWAWNQGESHLQPVLWHGYPPRVMSQLPMVQRDDDNATAVAFRTAQARVIHDSASGECAFVIPLRTASGCVGALAVELRRGREATKSCIAVATLLAAQLAPIADSLSQPEQLSLPQAVNGAAL